MKVRGLAIALAVSGGAAFITATGVLAESGLRSHVPVARFGLADVVVSAEQTISQDEDLPVAFPERAKVPADLGSRLARFPGVAAAIEDMSFPAAIVHGHVVPGTGHGWASTALFEHWLEGRPPRGPGEVALDVTTARAAEAEVGDRVSMVVAGQRGDYVVSAVLETSVRGVYFDRDGPADLVALRLHPGVTADDIRREFGGFEVRTGAAIGDAELPGIDAARLLLVLISGGAAGITLLVIGFIVTGAVLISVAGQRKDLALLRAVGATPRQVRRRIANQATVVTLFAAIPGTALGYVLAQQFRRLLRAVIPDELPLVMSPLPAFAAVLLLLLATRVAGLAGAWRVSRLPVTEALAESDRERKSPSGTRIKAGFLVLLASAVISTVPLLTRSEEAAAATAMTGILAVIGLSLAGPAVVKRVAAVMARLLPPGVSAPVWLAVQNCHGYAFRVAGSVTALSMAVTLTVTYVLAHTTMLSAATCEVEAGTHAQAMITAPGLGGVPPDVLAHVRAASETATPVSTTSVLWPHLEGGKRRVEPYRSLVLGPDAATVVDLDVRAGSLADLTGSTIALSATAARFMDTDVGRHVDILLGDGTPARPRVVAIYQRGLGFGDVVVARELHTGLDDMILVRTDRDFVLGQPGLVVRNGTPRLAQAPPQMWLNFAVLAVLLGYVLLAVASRIVAATGQRKSEVVTLSLIGMTPRQIRAMARHESAVIAGLAVGFGLLLSLLPLGFLSIGFLDRPWPSGPVWPIALVVLVVVLIAWLAVELPMSRLQIATRSSD